MLKTETIGEVKANLEIQIAGLDKKVATGVKRVDKLNAQRAGLATLLEKVNRAE